MLRYNFINERGICSSKIKIDYKIVPYYCIALLIFLMSGNMLNAQNIQGIAPVISPKGGHGVDGGAFAGEPTGFTTAGDFFYVRGAEPNTPDMTTSPGGLFYKNAAAQFGYSATYEDTYFIRDQLSLQNANDATIFTSTNKYDDDPNTYTWGPGNVPPKNELQTIIAHFTKGNPALGGDPNDLWVVFAADRAVTTGSSFVDFGFLQNKVSMVPTDPANPVSGKFVSEGPHGGRTLGDILVTIEFQQGGAAANVVIRRWEEVVPNTNPKTYTYNLYTNYPPGTIFGTQNTLETIVPYPIYNNSPISTNPDLYQYEVNQYAEGAINLTQAFEGGNPCFSLSTLFVRTRTSGESGNSEIKDFPTGGPIQLELDLTPTVEIAASPVSCDGAMDGIVSITNASGYDRLELYKVGTPDVLIATHTDDSDFTGLSDGSYYVKAIKVVGNAECDFTSETVIVLSPPQLTCTASELSPVVCNGESNGSASVSPVGGNGGYTYLWDNGETTQTATGLSGGLHSVTVTDSKGCTTSCEVTIGEPPQLTCTASELSPVVCNGESNGSASVSPVGGNGGYTYLWDNGETTQTATELSGGLHSVTVTDSKGCTTSCEVTIGEPPQLTCAASELSPVVCNGESNGSASVSPVGGNGGYTYLWDNGETTQTATELSGGLHSVTVTDSKGCTTSCEVTIGEPPQLTCTASELSPVVCNGESNGSASVSPVGGNGGYTYLWDNGETTQTATGLSGGLHSVTVTDSKGCTTSCEVTIGEPPQLTCTASELSPVVCNGESNGSASVSPVGGNGGYTYLWDNGETTQTATGLSGGLHSVTVTDSKGCTTSCEVTIGEPPQLTCTASELSPVVCNGESNGSASVSPVGGNGGYTYLWDNGETTQTATELSGGLHSVTVTDSKGCTTSCEVTIGEPPQLTCTASELSPVVCNGESNGSASVSPVGGNGGYTYLWDNGETTQTATELSGGLHSVTVTDSKGCTTSCEVTIGEPPQLTCTASELSPVVCNGESNGSASVSPVGGNGGYTYLWDNGETTQTATELSGGLHSVTVTDSKGCTTSCEVTIGEPPLLTCSIGSVTNDTCTTGSDGSATVTPVGGTGPYSYLWDNGETGATATMLSPGSHSVIVTDANKCTTTCTTTIVADVCEECETVYGYNAANSSCFLNDPVPNNRWGWTNLISAAGTYYFNLYEGAANCDINNGTLAGVATVVYNNGKVTVTYNMNPGFSLSETHVYIGRNKYPKKNGNITVAPGHYNYNKTFSVNVTQYTAVNNVSIAAPFYVIIHGVSCSASNGDPTVTNVAVENSETVNNQVFKNQKISLSPNPYVNEINIKYNYDFDTDVEIDIIDINGFLIKSIDNSAYKKGTDMNVKVELSNAINKMLFVKITTNKGSVVKKIISTNRND